MVVALTPHPRAPVDLRLPTRLSQYWERSEYQYSRFGLIQPCTRMRTPLDNSSFICKPFVMQKSMRKIAMFDKEMAAIVVAMLALAGAGPCWAAPASKTAVASAKPISLRAFGNRLTVMPQPQQVFALNGEHGAFKFDANTVLWAIDASDRPGIEMLQRDLKFRAGLQVPIVEGKTPVVKPGAKVVRFERNDAPLRAPLQAALLKRLELEKSEGYSLLAEGSGIVVRGRDLRGVLYGVQTLRQLVRADLSVAPVAIRDWPDMPWRQVYGYYNGVLSTTEQVQQHIEQAVMSKANMVIMESNWSGAGNWWFNPTGDRKVLADYFFETCRRYGLEPIPLVQGPGWGYGVTDQDAMTAEGEWIKAEPVTLQVDQPTALAKVNVVTTESAPIVVTDLSGKTRYAEGKDFSVIAGDTSRPYAETNAPWKLQVIRGGALGNGGQVLVSYNHVTPNYHKAFCLSEPRSYAIVDRTIDYVMKTYKPSIINIGHDELWELATDSRCKESNLKPEELVYRDLMHWYNRIKSHNPKTIILVWDDLFRNAPKGEVSGPLLPLVQRIPKDIVLCPWYYYVKPEAKADIEQRLSSQTAMGFPVIGVPSGYWMANTELWRNALQPYLKSGQSKGLMFTDWGEGLSATHMPSSMELMWSGSRMDKALFDAFAAVSQRFKDQSLGMTYEYARPWQKEHLTKFFNEGVQKKSPAEVAREVRQQLSGDTSIFQKAYGKEQWASIAHDAPFTVQQASMVVKLPLLFDQFAAYFDAKARYERGDTAQALGQVRSIVEQLHGIGYFSFDEEQRLLKESQSRLLSAQDLFGLDLKYLPVS